MLQITKDVTARAIYKSLQYYFNTTKTQKLSNR